MQKGNLSRRGFLARSLAGLTLGAGLPAWYAREVLAQQQQQPQPRQPGPNDRIVMGAIGTGGQGRGIMMAARRQTGVQMVAVCDVDRGRRQQAATQLGGRITQFNDFRELLQNRDIQAVTIGTPDHWHALIAIAAMRAGKDVYCEKPLTLTVDEGRAMVRVARATNKILQTGSQQRSDARFRLACQLVRNGRIGRVRRIETRIGGNPRGGPFMVAQPPEGLDWDFWLGSTPRVDYVRQRCHYEFRWWYEYSGGKMTDWGAHHNDIAQWALGMDDSGPVEVETVRADAPDNRANCYNCHPTFAVRCTYANGTQLICQSQGENGVRFEGEDGKWIFVSRGTIRANDGNAQTSRLLNDPLPRDATRLEVSANHMGNFISCVRSRRQPITHVGVGHRSVTVCHLCNIAVRTGRRLRWDPAQERFTGEHAEEGNRLLSRPMRAPWDRVWREQVGNA
ncbi:MAG: Gfo/Idh/MocA family oxidoreductase [Gemmataceae bacterium]|nr:Gfo/Idh/MocA family oxidoreductase [Gemmataceae bacterium]